MRKLKAEIALLWALHAVLWRLSALAEAAAGAVEWASWRAHNALCLRLKRARSVAT